MKRTNYCGALRETEVGKTVTVCGWVQVKRDMGGVIFIDVRDREGILQVVFNSENLSKEDFEAAEKLKNQSVIAVSGLLTIRGEETYNSKLITGTIELKAQKLEVLSEAEPLPFSLDEGLNIREDLRLKYRFLDIRRPEILHNIRYRHQVQKASQEFLDAEGFIFVETPMLTKSTPEGARDYLVPSRVHPGHFYALPQSPQIFKQLLMVGGIDKYYQVARCFRDEDLRADRQPEFTQVDLEMSFVEQEDVLVTLEKMLKYIFKKVENIEFSEPFLRLTYQQAMDIYGSDKPDLRFDLPIIDITDLAAKCSFSVFRSVVDGGGVVRAINAKGCGEFTRSTIEELTQKAVNYDAKGMAWIAIRQNGELYSILTKYFKPEELDEIVKVLGGEPGDFILFCADKLNVVRKTLGNLRLDLAEILGFRKKNQFKILFVTDFPQFEYSEEEKRYMAAHHPFTMPYPEDVQYLFSDPARVRSQAYDVVLNGVELGSGSVRIHRKDLQQKMFQALGFSDAEIEERFGFMVNAFKYGTPPHAGFGFGLDRLVMLMVGADSLREIIAFPKNKEAVCPMTEAPSPVDSAQLKILGLDNLGATAQVKEQVKGAKPIDIDVNNVAHLARLKLVKEEKQTTANQMGDIIAFANHLNDIDTADVPITAHVVPMRNVWREDKVTNKNNRDLLLSNTPAKQDGHVYVPLVVDSEE